MSRCFICKSQEIINEMALNGMKKLFTTLGLKNSEWFVALSTETGHPRMVRFDAFSHLLYCNIC